MMLSLHLGVFSLLPEKRLNCQRLTDRQPTYCQSWDISNDPCRDARPHALWVVEGMCCLRWNLHLRKPFAQLKHRQKRDLCKQVCFKRFCRFRCVSCRQDGRRLAGIDELGATGSHLPCQPPNLHASLPTVRIP